MKHLNFLLLTIISLILLVSITSAQVSHPASEITAGTFGAGDYTITNTEEVFISISNTEAGGHDYRLVSAGSCGGCGIGVGKFSIYDSTAGQSRLTIGTDGNVDIPGGITVADEIQLARVSDLGTCDSTNLGALVFKTTDDEPYVCTGSNNWVSMSGSGAPGDSDGDGVQDVLDCSPDDDPLDTSTWKFQLKPCYLDRDSDGRRANFPTLVCSGDECAGSTGSSGTDCDDDPITGSQIYQNFLGFIDSDDDDYGTGPVINVCSGNSLLSGYAGIDGDCLDDNEKVNPDGGAYTYHRGDGSFDYNCDGVQQKSIPSTIPSCQRWNGVQVINLGSQQGWSGTVPACGATGNYIRTDFVSGVGCVTAWQETRTQSCN
jgi:hypothetical protein|tara:strand:+ start:613 stop:1734 length:1122 start_codon:yes stop_codon:yes gene_type:complete